MVSFCKKKNVFNFYKQKNIVDDCVPECAPCKHTLGC